MGQSSCSEVFQAPRSKATKTPRPTWQPPVTLSPRRPPDLQQLREELQAKERALQLLRNEAIDERRVKAIEMWEVKGWNMKKGMDVLRGWAWKDSL